MKPRLLDLFSGAGGCAHGYQRAGFYVVGVDINPQPRYAGDEFIQGDALEFIDCLQAGGIRLPGPVGFDGGGDHRLWNFDAIHASPPCQGYANVTLWRGSQDDHPQLIEATRERLLTSGLPFVIENVRTKALRPCMVLCGSMFGLAVRRHRGFETSWNGFQLVPPCQHRSTDMAFMHKHERAYADAMGCEWMTAREAREAIPPAYTEFVGGYLMAEVLARRARVA